ncbi:MAG: class I SAM-dependent methyltransferase [Candidatus Competibacteraceae bacterium]|uniref:Methyltransferase type 12 n=1 Tax=Candidatus Contendobacter odensis Run_B_J11 TaxID=1400861 RepID=A0A7U7J1Y9_9GAMM|nr:class I SAM-dependent methyltransferase [Candidatus Contendobacter odensis]MBK8536299.1 class I SAM-dependent methyltransferase [Candidatus Competibacteraceae bacterium]MBK8752486.1 class I SAM-dependent methyltransferase [Candidatus Competibacteraceae bacterium]CDH43476.1 putative Methyltransferase type 12 [Candidatus Contendobacter odensis Run_B_J11]
MTAGAAAADQALKRYYRFHARIYDATRWSFLFGRAHLVERVAALHTPRNILEIGCGTGRNLARLAQRFPDTRLIGLDLSADMLACARRYLEPLGDRITLLHQAYARPLDPAPRFDLIVVSYCLSMINPGYAEVIASIRQDLQAHGLIAVVDFHNSDWSAFRRWMGVNHVRMEGQLLPELRTRFRPLDSTISQVYGGIWRYFHFIGTPV